MTEAKDPSRLGDRIAQLMQARGIDQRELATRTGLSASTISRVISGERSRLRTQTIKSIAHALGVFPSTLLGIDPSAIPPHTNFPDHDIVRNTDFVGREDELRRLHEQLSQGNVAITHALSGEGGIGKTQLAVEYAFRHVDDYDSLWWIGGSNDAIEASLFKLASNFDPQVPPTATPDDIRRLISSALAQGKHLLILDSLEDAARMKGLTVTHPSRLLITTRLANLPTARIRDFPVEVLARDASIRLLARHRPDLLACLPPSQGGTKGGPQLHTDLNLVADHLGDHALSLTLCGQYLRSFPNKSPRDLLKKLQSADIGDKKSLLDELDPAELGTNYRHKVAQSLTLHLPAFENTTAMTLLSLASYCHPDDISIDLLADAAQRLLRLSEPRDSSRADARPPSATVPSGDPIDLDSAQKALRKLADLSIVDYKDKISLHRLTQQAVRSQNPRKTRDSLLTALLGVLNQRFAKTLYAPENWAMQDQHAAHAVACISHAEAIEPTQVAVLANQVALYFENRARFAEAEPLMRRALDIDEKSYGPNHPDVARDLNNLAQLLQATNRLADAEPLMRRALDIDEKSYGPNHPNVAIRLNNLAQLLQDTNCLAEAEPLMRRALDIDEKSYGPQHPEVATDLNNLAQLLQDTNRLAEAEPLMRRALDIEEKSYGPQHPKVAIRLNNLAQLLQATNRLADAEPLMRRALDIAEKAYGPDHPTVAIHLNNLAQLLQDTNRLADAEPLMRRALDIDEKSYEPNHPDVATALNNLAQLLKGTNRLADAEPLMRRALDIDEKSYGPNHPKVAIRLNNLAALLQATNRLADAEPLMRRAMDIDEKAYGPNHPNVAISLNNLAALLKATNRLADAEPLIRRVVETLRDFTRATGHQHPHMQTALRNYRGLLEAVHLPAPEISARLRDLAP
ncbi:MAG: tetratricopeptide repeat protein [Planctomycetota bacterium]